MPLVTSGEIAIGGSTTNRSNAGICYKYIEENDCFLEPKVYNSWILNENCDWEAPIPYPEDGILYDWNEETLSWDVVEIL